MALSAPDALSRAYAGVDLLPAITSAGSRFFEPGEAHASDTEVLVIALLVIKFEASPEKTHEWASRLAAHAAEAAQEQELWSAAAAPVDAFVPIKDVCAQEWDLGTKMLVMRAVALRNWSGRGARDDIDDDQLTNYKSFLTKKEGYLRGVTPTGAKRKPKRLLTWSATRVADLIHRRGPVLREALGLPPAAAALPSAPSMIEENAALTATIALKNQRKDQGSLARSPIPIIRPAGCAS